MVTISSEVRLLRRKKQLSKRATGIDPRDAENGLKPKRTEVRLDILLEKVLRVTVRSAMLSVRDGTGTILEKISERNAAWPPPTGELEDPVPSDLIGLFTIETDD